MTAIQFLAEWALRSSAFILSGTLVLRALRVKDAAIRLAAWTAMLGGSLAMPLLTAALPKTPLIRLAMPNLIPRQTGTLWEIDRRAAVTGSANSRHGANISTQSAGISKGYDWPRFALTIYFTHSGFLLLRLCAGLIMSNLLLRRSRATGRTAEGIEIRESDRVSAPLSLGIVRPAILLPCDWRDWDGAKLGAVLAHERSHILRRDPAVQLLSTIHRTVLWHSPLSWYLHRNIVRVAEEASDDAAVAATNDPTSYAEMLLGFMQRSVHGSDCQGVAMARYGSAERRIHRILDGTAPSGGISGRRIAAILAIGAPLAFVVAAGHPEEAPPQLRAASAFAAGFTAKPSAGTASTAAAAATPVHPGTARFLIRRRENPARLAFAAASVRLSQPGSRPGPIRALPGGDGYSAQDASVKLMIGLMYKIPARQIVGDPRWLAADGYDIEAKADHAHTLDELHAMFQNLLSDRFQLKFHKEIRQGPVYTLTVDAAGSKMKVNQSSERFDYPIAGDKDGVAVGTKVPMEYLCWWLGQVLYKYERPVIDKTGLDKQYDFRLSFAPDLPPGFPREKLPPGILDRPSIFDALSDQLGLKLQAENGPVDYFVIDHVERPAGN
jgi:uncharacterized protein (TIGR03435 family)